MRIVHTLPAPSDSENSRVQEQLRRLAVEGLTQRGCCLGAAKSQLDWELQRVTDSGRASQYLMLRDIVLQAKTRGIPVSPGYSRMCNSILAYALGLCEPAPFEHGLVIGMSPHIFHGAFGINVSADRARELIDYVKSEYSVGDNCRSVDLVELPALDLMQGVAERAGLAVDTGFWDSVPLNDCDTFQMLGDGDTGDIYQLDSKAVKTYLREWRPKTFTELYVLTALNRFGVEELIPEVAARARGKVEWTCRVQLLTPFTADSYGFVIWQEQIIRALADLAGYDGGTSDDVRRVMCKKRVEVVEKARARFVSGCGSHRGLPETMAKDAFDELEKWAAHAYCKAHAVAHGMLTYRLAYLKAHWRWAFDAELEERGSSVGIGPGR